MLGMAGEVNDEFCRDKIIADFGCGPRGSLEWINSARITIGIDVLADAYTRFDIARHKACYVCSTENKIPLPSNYVDILYTMNSLDHVDRLDVHCRELLRILAPGGSLIGSFNLDEPSSQCEPQTLTEEKLATHLLNELQITSYRIVPKPRDGKDTYQYFFEGVPEQPDSDGYRILWVRATKA